MSSVHAENLRREFQTTSRRHAKSVLPESRLIGLTFVTGNLLLQLPAYSMSVNAVRRYVSLFQRTGDVQKMTWSVAIDGKIRAKGFV